MSEDDGVDMVIPFEVGWLNRGEKTGDRLVNPILIGEGLKYLRLGVALVQEGFDNCFE